MKPAQPSSRAQSVDASCWEPHTASVWVNTFALKNSSSHAERAAARRRGDRSGVPTISRARRGVGGAGRRVCVRRYSVQACARPCSTRASTSALASSEGEGARDCAPSGNTRGLSALRDNVM